MAEAAEIVGRDYPDCVINFGLVRFFPGAYNIVPGTAELALELRAPEAALLERLERELLDCCHRSASRHSLEIEIKRETAIPPAPCDAEIQDAFARAAATLGVSSTRLASGAGHDTGAMAAACPAGMILVPSTGGSHNPGEHAEWDGCVAGANVLLHTAIELVTRRSPVH
jgi:N-carbamoyl-L-amino-acid hydrolase